MKSVMGRIVIKGKDNRVAQHGTSDLIYHAIPFEDLLVDHGGKDKEYNFYKYAGVVTKVKGKGTHVKEDKPVNIKSNLP